MGNGIDLARAAGAGIHADVLDDFKDQLLIVFLNRLADKSGNVSVPVLEVDATGALTVSFRIEGGMFHFEVRRKQ